MGKFYKNTDNLIHHRYEEKKERKERTKREATNHKIDTEKVPLVKKVRAAIKFEEAATLYDESTNPAGIYLLKVNNRNTGTRCEICSKLTIKTPERRLASFWCLYC